jgi:uncharacterized protein YjdB
MNRRIRALCFFAAALVLCALPVDALAAVKQKSVSFDTKLITIDLAKGNTYRLSGKVLPENANQRMIWRSGKKAVAAVNQSGLITAKKIGTVQVGARPATRNNWNRVVVKVVDSLAPTSISLNAASLNLTVGGTYELSATAAPENAAQSVRWLSRNKAIASVSSTGVVTARRAGTTYVRAISTRDASKHKTIKVTVKKRPNPSKLTISPATTTLEKGSTLQLSAAVTPASANASVKWATNNKNIATVSQAGLVTAKRTGTVKIKVTSKARSSVYTIRTLKIVDSTTVTSVAISSEDTVLRVGNTLPLSAKVLPATTSQSASWSSNNTAVATVSASGTVTGKKAGSATITATAGGKTDTLRVVVLSASPVDDEPAQITSVAGISGNLAKIDAIMRYATTELDALYVSGAIGKTELNARKTIVLNAFKMARFPWMSSTTIGYWSGSGSYQRNVVYFGTPYTQRNRNYDVPKLLNIGAFKMASGNAYYTANLANRTYPGNDCSSFVSMSQWGTGSSYATQNSTAMKATSIYKTVATSANKAGYLNLRPGDTFVKNGHVAMFLYYANSSKSQIMIIQQGGYSTLSTVSCDVKALTYYSNNAAYIARRKTSFS